MATPPFSITRRDPSIVTTVPPRTIRSTTVFLLCAMVVDAPKIVNTNSVVMARFMIILIK
jgi:hypothetical protein